MNLPTSSSKLERVKSLKQFRAASTVSLTPLLVLVRFTTSAVSIRIVVLPPPVVDAHLIEGSGGSPAHQSLSIICRGVIRIDISRTARLDFIRDALTANPFESSDDFQNTAAAASAQIDDEARRAVQLSESGNMARSKIHHVDIIPDTSTIRGIVVAAPDVEALASSNGDLRNKWKQVVGHAFWMLSDEAARMGTDGIEVAKDAYRPARIACELVAKHFLDHELGSAVRIYGVERVMLGIGQELGYSVDRRGGAENELPETLVLHCPEKSVGADDVVVVVIEGTGHRVLD